MINMDAIGLNPGSQAVISKTPIAGAKAIVDSIDKSKLPVIRQIDSAMIKNPSTTEW
jgi:hypothetical protein